MMREEADVLAARTRRFENERNVVAKAPPLPKKSMAWAGGTITTNKEAALKKFLQRKAARGETVEPALLQKAMEARGERAAVAVDPQQKGNTEEKAKPIAPSSSAQLKQKHANTRKPMSKAAMKNAKRNAKKRDANKNAHVAAEIHTSLFR